MSKIPMEKNYTLGLKWLFIAPVKLYQIMISPFIPHRCRFYPSCSAYTIDALKTHKLLTALWLSGKRLLKCHPWHDGGIDPVPPKK